MMMGQMRRRGYKITIYEPRGEL